MNKWTEHHSCMCIDAPAINLRGDQYWFRKDQHIWKDEPRFQSSVFDTVLSFSVAAHTASLHSRREWQERNRRHICVRACVRSDMFGDLFKELSFNQHWQPFRDHLPFIWSTRLGPPVKVHSDQIMVTRQHSDSRKTQNQYFTGDSLYFRGSFYYMGL